MHINARLARRHRAGAATTKSLSSTLSAASTSLSPPRTTSNLLSALDCRNRPTLSRDPLPQDLGSDTLHRAGAETLLHERSRCRHAVFDDALRNSEPPTHQLAQVRAAHCRCPPVDNTQTRTALRQASTATDRKASRDCASAIGRSIGQSGIWLIPVCHPNHIFTRTRSIIHVCTRV
jgi:hypothetical protein